MIRAVALDLMDTVVRDPYREALRAATGASLATLLERRDPDLYPALERGEIEEADYWAHHRSVGIEVDPARFHEVRRDGTTWLPGMRELLDDLQGVALRVTASNYPTWIEQLAEEVLGDRFDRVLASCHLGARKPDPRFYQRLLTALDLAPDEVAFVDDRETNVLAARQVGLPAICFAGAGELRAWLRELGLDLAEQPAG